MKRFILLTIILSVLAVLLTSLRGDASDAGEWHDTFYQYRIPVEVKVDKPGWVRIPVDEEKITAAVNKLEELKYDPQFFAYNYIKVVEVDRNGNAVDGELMSGFYMIPEGDKLSVTVRQDKTGRREAMFEGASGMPPKSNKKDEVILPVEPFQYYLLRYTSEGGGSSPALNYEPVFPIGSRLRRHGVRTSYESRLLQQSETRQKTLLFPDADTISLRFGKRFITRTKDVSLQKVKIALLANVKNAGKHRFMIYYQPMCSHYLMVPERYRTEMPKNAAKVLNVDSAEKYLGSTRYSLASNEFFTAWFGESTVKLTPNTPVPASSQTSIHITSAKNEKQSFQLILSPKRPFHFQSIAATDLKNGDSLIPASGIDFQALDYVPIHRSSYISPARYIGWIADPMVEAKAELLSPFRGNFSIWVTVAVEPAVAAGKYRGMLKLQTKENGTLSIPLELTVYDFALPEFSPFQASMGGQEIYKSGRIPPIVNADYHGVKTKADLLKLGDAYFEVMARNKFTPSNAALYTEIGMKWSPPPEGYNVDKPGNYFRLYDWDFTEYNKKLDYYINTLKVNQLCLYHTNPKTSSTFVYLPTEELKEFNRNAPRLMMGWQTFRDAQFVAYDLNEKHPYWNYKNTIGITRDQFDHLLLDYLRAIAKNLDEHGWLDYATILIDESHNDKYFLHFLRVLKSDPLVARIRVGVCMQYQSYLYYKENENDTAYAYNNLLDYYIPELNENYNRWEDYFFDDYNITRDRKKLMPYGVTTSRSAIDVPGMTNRILPMDIFRRGGSGYLIWGTFKWPHAYKDWEGIHPIIKNPWIDPFGRHGNGALSFFYPPKKDGFAEEPDFTITPSARVMMFREAVDDYEYAYILENLVKEAQKQKVDATAGKLVLNDINRFFHNSVHWSQNDAWYLDLRDRMAGAIVDLKVRVKKH